MGAQEAVEVTSMYTREMYEQVFTTGLTLGVGAIIGAIAAAFAIGVMMMLLAKSIKIMNNIEDFRDMRKERKESATSEPSTEKE